jgi:NADH:ubiquinone oxidoreductase subunit K
MATNPLNALPDPSTGKTAPYGGAGAKPDVNGGAIVAVVIAILGLAANVLLQHRFLIGIPLVAGSWALTTLRQSSSQDNRSRVLAIIALIVAVISLVVGLAKWTSGGLAQSFTANQCITIDAMTGITTDGEGACDGTRNGEIVAVRDEPAGDFPGADALQTQADTWCQDAALTFIGTGDNIDSRLESAAYVSSEAQWKSGDRQSVCVIFYSDLSNLPAGTLKGSSTASPTT